MEYKTPAGPAQRGFFAILNPQEQEKKDEPAYYGELNDRASVPRQTGETMANKISYLPTFTKPARQRWESIPLEHRKLFLSKVWCGNCSQGTTITDFSGRIERGDLILTGQCARCCGNVARVIEGS